MSPSSEHPEPSDLAAAQARIQALEATVATLQGRLHDQRRFLDQFSRHAPAAIAMFDRQMQYLMVSDRWLEDYRLQGQDLLGRSHYEVFPEIPQRWKEVHQRCLKGVIESCEADAFPRADGQLDYINWVVAPWYKNHDTVGGLIFFTEVVTEQVEAQENLKRLHQELKDSHQKLEEYADAITHAVDGLIASGIDAARELSVPEVATDPGAVRDQAAFLHAGLRRMQRMMQGLRAFTRVGNHTGYHAVDLNQVLQAVLADLAAPIGAQQAQITHRHLPVVQANEFEMIALFQNLIGNALRYHGPGRPEVSLRVEAGEGLWRIEVADNGPGIPEDLQAEIFQLFRRTDLDPTHQGIGISLPVCKRIVEGMGGEIWLESSPGAGTRIFFTLPA